MWVFNLFFVVHIPHIDGKLLTFAVNILGY